MKRAIFSVFLAALSLIFAACGASAPKTTSAKETAAAESKAETAPEETKPSTPSLTVKEPLSKAEFESLPVADASMTEEELRRLVVDYYKMMATIRWVPSRGFEYEYSTASTSDSSGNLSIKGGRIYAGMPYTKASAGLQDFLDFYDEKTGVLDVEEYKNTIAEKIGNNCATSVFWAWARVTGSVDYTATSGMALVNGCLKVGDYVYDETRDYTDQSTKEICEKNGEQKMYACYALAKAGDGTVKYVPGGAHHARLLIENAYVVHNADGTIDGEQSYFLMAEQGSAQTATADEKTGEKYSFITQTENKYSFSQLFKEGSLPLTVPELAGTKKVQKAEASVDLEGAFSADAVSAAVLTANYPISRVSIRFVGEDGEEALQKSVYSEAYQTKFTLALKRLSLTGASLRRSLTEGKEYTVEISVRLGNGETLPVYTAPYTA